MADVKRRFPGSLGHRGWNEQYLLRALLTGSPRYRVLFASHHARHVHETALREAMAWPTTSELPGGRSFWFERV